jgi:hypothetical protein
MKTIKELEVGDIIINNNNHVNKILAKLDKHDPYIYLLSSSMEHNSANLWYTEYDLECYEYKLHEKQETRWKPKIGETYFYINFFYSRLEVAEDRWDDLEPDLILYQSGNCFKTRKEAEAKLKVIKKLLKERTS